MLFGIVTIIPINAHFSLILHPEFNPAEMQD
nr:MAG TPA: hypothetical protein [Caudoviricetes sp.]